jgi:acyl carrier protein
MSTPAPASIEVPSNLRDGLLDLGIDPNLITPDAELRADLDIDSAELVELVAALSEDQAPDGKALKNLRTIAELAHFLNGTHA